MSTAELRVESHEWSPRIVEGRQPSAGARLARQFVGLWGAGLLLADIVVIIGAFLLAYWARFSVPDAAGLALGIEEYVRVGLIVAVVTVALLASHELYDEERQPHWAVRLRSIVSSVSTALVLTVAVSYFLGDQAFSRLWFATSWLFAVVALAIWRGFAHRLYVGCLDALAPMRRVLIVGANPLGEELATELGGVHHVLGFADNGSDLDSHNKFELLGSISEIERLVQAYAVDELIIALPANRREQVSRVLARGFHRRVTVKFLPEMDGLPHRFDVQQTAGRRYIEFSSAARVTWLKRALDLALVGLGVFAMLPMFALVAIAIRLDSDGPIFYRQQRVGRNGQRFMMLKFRSMRVDADRCLEELRDRNEAIGPLFKMRQDPRITRVGGFLRRWSIDELPQLINVLRGDMSLVGPRPPLPTEVAEYEDWQLGRLRAVPGLTGLWQVSGRSEVPFLDMVRLDLHYIRNWSFALDLQILLRTIPAVLSNRGAY